MPIIQDKEFGKITIHRSNMATQVRIRVTSDGTLRASMPVHAPMFLVKHLINTSRHELRKIISQTKPEYVFENGMQIGKSHTLIIQATNNKSLSVSNRKQKIIVKLPLDKNMGDPDVTRKVRDSVISALRLEAKSYLPNRLSYLAGKYDYKYEKVRFSHASSRWGSCGSNGTISLNIALMKLPFELIDYIIIHELSHTKYMNHSPSFWEQVASADTQYKKHRRSLKLLDPSI
jgi:hypothetical protein